MALIAMIKGILIHLRILKVFNLRKRDESSSWLRQMLRGTRGDHLWFSASVVFLLQLGIIQSAFAQNVWQKYYEPMGGSGSGRAFINEFAIRSANLILLLISGGAVLAIMWGGFEMLTSKGNEEGKEKAKKITEMALYGLMFSIMAQAIINMVANMVTAIVN